MEASWRSRTASLDRGLPTFYGRWAAIGLLRATFRWKADGLDIAGLSTRIASSELTLGGLLKHLACVEDVQFTMKLDGDQGGLPDRRPLRRVIAYPDIPPTIGPSDPFRRTVRANNRLQAPRRGAE